MHDTKRLPQTPSPGETLTEILAVLKRLEQRLDDFAQTYLESRFPFGKPNDRWRRGA
jgi:hypothetical protein